MIGERLKSLRLMKKLSQIDLGKIIGISNVTLSQYESNDRQPDNKTLKAIADFFNVSTDYLLGLTDEPEPAKNLKEKLSWLLNEEHKGSITLFPKKDHNRPYTIDDWPAFMKQLPEDQAMHHENMKYPDDQKLVIMELARKAKQKKQAKVNKLLDYSDEVIDDALIYAAFDDEKRKKMNEED
ncbi:helix-turn-helix domain-containing protein [Acetobacterium tundrae]|uniref:Helix-turn-helix domain-containing protein n=1 Tax=Acetobacterium tundrae TaxID=132932 RepID=A0ABR6WPS1_9FIRM|nr:helix-turn-helix transcriptional regulator [Acetobacterium tundrae]MBC3798464.1 helix-turn-helix domain-containing protein [Acetobacterium tundrae]